MASKEEYEAVYGPVPEGTSPATEWGDGGCFIVTRFESGYVIGRWSDKQEAFNVQNKLTTKRWSYEVLNNHHWVPDGKGQHKCQTCGEDWPGQ